MRSLPIEFVLSFLLATSCEAAGAGTSVSEQIASVEIVGTSFKVTLASGRTLEGKQLEGAVLSLLLPNQIEPRRIRLRSIVTDPMDPQKEVLLYKMSMIDPATGHEEEICEPDPEGNRWSFPLRGQWDRNGRQNLERRFHINVCGRRSR